MAQARWNGSGGGDERRPPRHGELRGRHELTDAARGRDWPRMLRMLDRRPDCAHASRPAGRARCAPLHQAANVGAPARVENRRRVRRQVPRNDPAGAFRDYRG